MTLISLPETEEGLTLKKLENLINTELQNRTDGKLGDDFVYLALKMTLEKVNNDAIKELEALIGTKNAVLCKIQKIIPELDIATVSGSQHLQSIDDILNRNPLDTLKETFAVKNGKEMTEHQEKMLTDLLNSLTAENDNAL